MPNRKPKAPVRKATHTAFPDVQVTFKVVRDKYMGDQLVEFTYDNGEKSSMDFDSFFKMFIEVK